MVRAVAPPAYAFAMRRGVCIGGGGRYRTAIGHQPGRGLKASLRHVDHGDMRRVLLPVLAALAAVLPSLLTASAADAQGLVPCVAGTKGPLCHAWIAKTTFVADGDTIRV